MIQTVPVRRGAFPKDPIHHREIFSEIEPGHIKPDEADDGRTDNNDNIGRIHVENESTDA